MQNQKAKYVILMDVEASYFYIPHSKSVEKEIQILGYMDVEASTFRILHTRSVEEERKMCKSYGC